MLREGPRPRGVGLSQGAPEGAGSLRAGRHPSQQGELPPHLRRRADCRRLSRGRVVRAVRSAGARADHPGAPDQRARRRDVLIAQHPFWTEAQRNASHPSCDSLRGDQPTPRCVPSNARSGAYRHHGHTLPGPPLRLAPAAADAGFHHRRACSRWRSASARPRRFSACSIASCCAPLPYPDPDRLAMVGSQRRQGAVARADLAGQLRRLPRPVAGVRGRARRGGIRSSR